MTGRNEFLWKDLFRKKEEEKSSLQEQLKSNILFATLTKRELKYLSHLVYERIYAPGEKVFWQNDRGFGMYFITKGEIGITTNTPDGEALITTLQAGAILGELSLVDPDNIRTANATAITPTTVIGFFKPDLMDILERRPAMGVKILFQLSTVIGRRLLETTEKITELKGKRNEAA